MGSSPSTLHKKLLPGKPNQYKEGSKVIIWHISDVEPKVSVLHEAVVQKVVGDGSKYDCVTSNGDFLKNIPFYLMSYPNVTRKWSEYFLVGQRCLYNEIYPVIILDSNPTHMVVRKIDDDTILMNVSPRKLTFDYLYFVNS